MQIQTSYQPFSHNTQTLQSQYLKDANIGDPNQIKEDRASREQEQNSIPPLGEIQRQTYGLSILERMSDDEYRAFLRATAEMTESEKIFAAQSLYRLNKVYQSQLEKHHNPYQTTQGDFLTAFHNAYQEALMHKA
ncbi:hypothetical protein [Helicobacter kayseriensis]|uniref:hypothetical protein n=1 Tax=Helicobacter kayseriensis TaxID=2905877 RepID=UPI001E52D983|nr:hypothetical protein [Helicobacter kayseriensis]MCE3046520.1 hypothetical protein [Helicobacter kayseriensis]MCE3048177.1 hypothetical protein [Helicobacter kayseriensis]